MTKGSNNLIIAIDGFSSSGKSTIAKALAEKLNYLYIDTGAMYRAITYKLMKENISFDDISKIKEILKSTRIEFFNNNGINQIVLDNEMIESQIRGLEVSNNVSEVSIIPEIREFLVKIQRDMGKSGSIVMDGRDIGTVVFPNADLKFFISADIDVRAQRRFDELNQKSGANISFDAVKENLIKRDQIDSNREHSPLKIADEAKIINTENLTKSKQVEIILEIVKDKLSSMENNCN